MIRIATLLLLLPRADGAWAAAPSSAALENAIERYERAQIAGDRAALQAVLADDYLLVTGGGEREDKQTFIKELAAPDFKLDPYTIQAPVRRVWKHGAVVAGIARQKGSSAGKRFDGCIRYADFWKLTNAGWQVAFTQVARMPAPGPQGCANL